MIAWDVNNGIARRAWARNPGARFAVGRAMEAEERLRVTLPREADAALVREAVRNAPQSGSKPADTRIDTSGGER